MDSNILLIVLLFGIFIAGGMYSLIFYFKRSKSDRKRLLFDFVILLATLLVFFTLAYFSFHSWLNDIAVGIWYLILASCFCMSLNLGRIVTIKKSYLRNVSGVFYSVAIVGGLLLTLLFYCTVKYIDGASLFK